MSHRIIGLTTRFLRIAMLRCTIVESFPWSPWKMYRISIVLSRTTVKKMHQLLLYPNDHTCSFAANKRKSYITFVWRRRNIEDQHHWIHFRESNSMEQPHEKKTPTQSTVLKIVGDFRFTHCIAWKAFRVFDPQLLGNRLHSENQSASFIILSASEFLIFRSFHGEWKKNIPKQ